MRREGSLAAIIALFGILLMIAGCDGTITGLVLFESGGLPNIMVKNITYTNSSAYIEWNTSVLTNSTLHINNNGQANATSTSAMDFAHNITGLEANTTYFFNITACDNLSNCNNLQGNFGTDLSPDLAAPAINITFADATNESASINWTTDENATCTLNISGYSLTSEWQLQFNQTVGGLNASTSYDYSITACDLSSNCNTITSNLTTDANIINDTTAPTITITNISTTDTTARVNWTTSENATSTFSIRGTNTTLGNGTQFTIAITGLNTSATYSFSITACDMSSNCYTATGSFATNVMADVRPPTISTPIIGTTNQTATVTWMTDERANSTFYSAPRNETFSFGLLFTTSLTGLSANTTYQYNITACDNSSNCNSTASSFTTNITRTEPPTITVTNKTTTSDRATVIWTTSRRANATIMIAASKTDYGFSTNFSKTASGLESAKTYSFNITVCDNMSNCNVLNDAFTTKSIAEDTEREKPNVTVSDPTLTVNSAIIGWTTSRISTCTFMFNNKETKYEAGTQFSASLTELESGITYSYKIVACDEYEVCETKEGKFTTKKPEPMVLPEPEKPKIEIPSPEIAAEEGNDSDMISGGVLAADDGKPKFGITNMILLILVAGAATLTFVNMMHGKITMPNIHLPRAQPQRMTGNNIPVPTPTRKMAEAPAKPQVEEIERLLENAGRLMESFQFNDSSEVYKKVREYYSDRNTTDTERSRIYGKMMGLYDRLLVYSMTTEVCILADRYRRGLLTKAEYYSLNMFMRQLREKLDKLTRENPKDKNLLIYSLNEYNKALNVMVWRNN